MSEFLNLKPAIAKIEADHIAAGRSKELERFKKAAKVYQSAQKKYKRGAPERKAAHREWLAAFDALWAGRD